MRLPKHSVYGVKMNLSTSAGVFTLVDPNPKKLKRVSWFIPLTSRFDEKVGGADYGVVMKYGDVELWAIKQQSLDFKPDEAISAAKYYQALITLNLKQYLEIGFKGVLMPCVYMRSKPKSLIEVGVAYFGAAEPGDALLKQKPHIAEIGVGTGTVHGLGFTKMVAQFIVGLRETSEQMGKPWLPVIDLDHRPRSHFETLVFCFLLHGKDLYSLKIKPSGGDPTWAVLVTSGINKAYNMPSVPFQTDADDTRSDKTSLARKGKVKSKAPSNNRGLAASAKGPVTKQDKKVNKRN